MTTVLGPRQAGEQELPAVASVALHQLISGPPVRGVVAGAGRSAVWIDLGSECIVLATGSRVRLPNGLSVVTSHWRRHVSSEALAGLGRVTLGDIQVVPSRWWDPRPRLTVIEATGLQLRISKAAEGIPDSREAGLEAALSSRDAAAFWEAAGLLLGRGEGLTPIGDDILAGALSAYVLFTSAFGCAEGADLIDGIRPSLMRLARERTTSLSAALLCHAMHGRVAGSVGPFLSALAEGGDVQRARQPILQIGHSSGLGLVLGILTGVRAVAKGLA